MCVFLNIILKPDRRKWNDLKIEHTAFLLALVHVPECMSMCISVAFVIVKRAEARAWLKNFTLTSLDKSIHQY